MMNLFFILAIIAACAYLISFTVYVILRQKKNKHAMRWSVTTFVLSFFIIIALICYYAIQNFH